MNGDNSSVSWMRVIGDSSAVFGMWKVNKVNLLQPTPYFTSIMQFVLFFYLSLFTCLSL